jgi:FtsH-binding integral membrane protein
MAADDHGATLEVARKEVIDVSTETLTRKDVIGTMVAALAVLVYVANVQEWGYLASNRWAAVTILAVGVVGCSLATRLEDENLRSAPIVVLAGLGIVALVLGVLAVATGAAWALLALTIVVVVLWAGTTLRHALTPAHPLASHPS